MAQAEAICRVHSVRLTPIRRRVLETLSMADKPLGAYELAERLAPQGRRMAPITVYRALDFLIDQGLVHRLASLNAYVADAGRSQTSEMALFLICESCGSVTEIASSELSETVSGLQRKHDFKARTKTLEVMGRCPHC